MRICMIFIFVGYYASSTFFVHTHHFDWGTVTHSHPYLPANAGHMHSAESCETIKNLSNAIFLGTMVLALPSLFTRIIKTVGFVFDEAGSCFEKYSKQLRAPPVVA